MEIILLTYINRSGSTFLLNTLNKHKSIAACPEADVLANLLLVKPYNKLSEYNRTFLRKTICEDPKFKLWNLPNSIWNIPNEISDNFSLFKYLLELFRKTYKPEASYVVYKAERLFQLMPDIFEFNPAPSNIKVISLVRDIRGIYLSQKKTLIPESGKPFSTNPVKTALYWRDYVCFLKNTIPQKKLIVRYEDLITNYKNILSELFVYLELSACYLDKSSYNITQFLSGEHKEIHANIDALPIIDKIETWVHELESNEKRILEIITTKDLKHLNYPLSPDKRYSFVPYLSMYILVFIELINRIAKRIIWKVKTLFRTTLLL